jgi:hypothetical protein
LAPEDEEARVIGEIEALLGCGAEVVAADDA